ncbi:MAG: PAS domain S-box protein [Planctomycetota bacterium]
MEPLSRAVLAAVLKAAVDAIVLIDARGIIQSVNTAALVMFGYNREELVGSNVSMLMPSPYHEEHDQYLQNFHATGDAKIIGIGREVEARRADGKTFPIHLAVSRVEAEGEVFFTGIIRDISDLKNTEAKLAQANEELENRVKERTRQLEQTQAELIKSEKLATLGHVSGGIAHEIRNPLNAVRTSVYYLRNAKSPSEEKVAEHLKRIDRQVSLIDNVITALSDIARLPEPATNRCDIPQLLTEAIGSVTLPSRLQIELEVDDGLQADADPNQLSIVFRNLIRNARDATSAGGTIRVSGTVDGKSVLVSVADTGVGIRDEDMKRITEPLYSTKPRGMGLGLAICTAILQKNHGHLSVESLLDEGTTFHVHLKKYLEG